MASRLERVKASPCTLRVIRQGSYQLTLTVAVTRNERGNVLWSRCQPAPKKKNALFLMKKKGELHYLILAHRLGRRHAPVGGSPRERGGHAYLTILEHLKPPQLHASLDPKKL